MLEQIKLPGSRVFLVWFLLFAGAIFPFSLSAQDTSIFEDVQVVPAEEENSNVGVYEEKRNTFIPRSLQPSGGGPSNIEFRTVPDSVTKSLLKDEEFWYVNHRFAKEDEPEYESNGDADIPSAGFGGLWILVLIAFVALIIWHLARNDVRFFRRGGKAVNEEIEEQPISDNIFEINYATEIQKAVQQKDYRLATRLYYLQLLRHLSERQLINYKPDATNWDYLTQLGQTKYYRDFFRVTRHYEYAWYGKFEISDETFALVKKDMEQFSYQFNQRA